MNETIIAAFLAFLTALGLAFWNSWLTRKAELNKELRLAVAEFTKTLAIGHHAMSWITWKAKNTPSKLTEGDISDYEKFVNSMFTDLVSSRVIVAALNKKIYTRTSFLVDKMYVIDEDIARAGALFVIEHEKCIETLAGYYDDVSKFEKEILATVAELISSEQAKR